MVNPAAYSVGGQNSVPSTKRKQPNAQAPKAKKGRPAAAPTCTWQWNWAGDKTLGSGAQDKWVPYSEDFCEQLEAGKSANKDEVCQFWKRTAALRQARWAVVGRGRATLVHF